MSKGPKAPDPYATSAAQTASNQQTANYNADLNRVSTYTPYGSSVYTQTGTGGSGAPLYRQDITLTPLAQDQLTNEQEQNKRLSSLGFQLGDQIQARLGQGIDGEAGTRQAAQDAQYARQTAFLDPQFSNAQGDLDSKLANKGVMEGSAAYQRAQDEFARQKEFSYGQARDQAISSGADAQARALANQLTLRNQPFNELASLRSGTAINNPTYQPTAQSDAQSTDVAGNVYKAYQLNSANSNNLMNGLFSLGSAAIMASDRRLKRDIVHIGRTVHGLALYAYRYLWSDRIRVGVMAQEALRVKPDAVLRIGRYLHVNYGAL